MGFRPEGRAEVTRSQGAFRVGFRLFGPPERIGRYLLGRCLGRGAQGFVYQAHDDRLGRDVAIKLVPGRTRGRWMREARMLARLSHPNVVQVYDIGSFAEGAYIVMELVEGTDLRSWSRQAPGREVAARRRVLWDAARGLLAAHRFDIVHRDFKPGNVLVGRDGRARVSDFGLARPGQDSETIPTDLGAVSSTSTVDVVGTPAYMAPEQHRGAPATPRSDQFSFCVAALEVLTGARPFAGETMPALYASKRAGCPPIDAPAGIPSSVIRALRRGLSFEPSQRWRDMSELVRVLAPGPKASRRLLDMGAVAIAGAGAWIVATSDDHRPCRDAASELAETWGDRRRDEVGDAVRGVAVPYAADTWALVGPRLDAYAEAWRRTYTHACEATAVHREQPESVLDLRMSCLRRARASLRATVAVLADADDGVVRRARELIEQLPAIESCNDVEALRADPIDTLDDRRASEEVMIHFARARADFAAGRYAEAKTGLGRTRMALGAKETGPIAIELTYWEAVVAARLGDPHTALERGQTALREATRVRNRRLMSEVAAHLAALMTTQFEQPGKGRAHAAMAIAVAPDARREGGGHLAMGTVLLQNGDYPGAVGAFRQALGTMEGIDAQEEPVVAAIQTDLALALDLAGRSAEAEAMHRGVLEGRRRALGPEHPDVGASLIDLAASLQEQQRHREAEALLREARSLLRRSVGPSHPDTLMAENNLSNVLTHLARFEEAEQLRREVHEKIVVTFGERHTHAARSLGNLATLLRSQGRLEEAEDHYRRALEIFEATLPREDPNVGLAHYHLAEVEFALGRAEAAEERTRRALEIFEAALDPSHVYVVSARERLATIQAEREGGDAITGPAQPSPAPSRRSTSTALPAGAGEPGADESSPSPAVPRAPPPAPPY